MPDGLIMKYSFSPPINLVVRLEVSFAECLEPRGLLRRRRRRLRRGIFLPRRIAWSEKKKKKRKKGRTTLRPGPIIHPGRVYMYTIICVYTYTEPSDFYFYSQAH